MPFSSKSKALLGLVLLVGLALAARPALPHVHSALGWIAASGWTGRLAFVGLYIAACVLFLPGSILTLGAGAVFGLGPGFALVSVASTAGAVLSFLLGRTVARGFVQRKVAADPRFAAIDAAVARDGWKIVGLARLSPVFPFNLLNYGLGLTSVGLRDYALASWIGMMPGTLLYVYLGSLAGGLASAAARERGPLEWALYGAGLLATVLVSVLVTRIARRALAQTLPAEEPVS